MRNITVVFEKSARVGGKYQNVGGKWKMRVIVVWVVNGQSNILK